MESANHLPNIIFPTSVSVTGQDIDISFLHKEQKQFYISLFERIVGLYNPAKPRNIIGFAGPTGSGKSVIASIFSNLAKQSQLPFRFQALGMDAFHYPNNYLQSHTGADGKVLKLVKGRYDTYNVPSLLIALQKFSAGETVSLPEYSRSLHNPVEDAYVITEKNVLLLVEGLWLYYDQDGWENIYPLFDYTYFIDADKESVKEMVLQRHERGGRTRASAEEHYNMVDAVNFDLVMQTRCRADEIIPSYYAIT